MKRLKSTSKMGQSLKSRADESQGNRKRELDRLSKVDKANYKKAPKAVKNKIKDSYKKDKKVRTKNIGKYI